ncbi:DUF983 domain-containing protein [Arcticibacterium luteifluviistationis]|uniref:DUF983 domain-containing protein n=1 Tax=Arcticibacterium luteifluviistationis TaxID=1784714 RepID=A0A2Z4GHN1_9BACT|nr:DUF983 domain-containing protein [Arcticibacterium luteifluviistationis]AWW00439.1 DUF983 domain-containing protein [Arcticibacterium luteifluviistationis]
MIQNIISMLNNNCPNCNKGKVFKTKSIILSFGFSEMETKCPNCNNKFEKEPGFFIGAMYASYGLIIAEIFITYIIASFFFEEPFDLRILGIITAVLLVLSFFNYRFSRIMWLYAFG